MLFWSNYSLHSSWFHRKRWHSSAPGKWLMPLSCLVNAITGWLMHSPLLWIRAEKKPVFLSLQRACVRACVSSPYGQTGSCSPQNPEPWCLWKHDCHRKCSTCLTVLQASKRWECFREEPSQSWGLLLMLAARPSGGCPESATRSMLRYSWTYVWTCMQTSANEV